MIFSAARVPSQEAPVGFYRPQCDNLELSPRLGAREPASFFHLLSHFLIKVFTLESEGLWEGLEGGKEKGKVMRLYSQRNFQTSLL